MTRNWRLAVLAFVAALSSASAAQASWGLHLAAPVQTVEVVPVVQLSQNDQTIWECLFGAPACAKVEFVCPLQRIRGCEDLCVTYARETAVRMLMVRHQQNRVEHIADCAGQLDCVGCTIQHACRIAAHIQHSQAAAGTEECDPPVKCVCSEKCTCANCPDCKCGEKCCCKAGEKNSGATGVQPLSRPPARTGGLSSVPTCRNVEILPMPTLVEDAVCTEGRCRISVPGLEGQADRLTMVSGANGGRRILLEGHVELNLSKANHPARILTGRAIINPADGSYEIMPIHFGTPASPARPAKPTPATKPTIEPMTWVVPSTPLERGWR